MKSEGNSVKMDIFDIDITDLKVDSRYIYEGKIYTEYNLIDGLADPWCSTDKLKIHFYFNKDRTITNIFIKNGFHKNSEFLNYNRVKKIKIGLGDDAPVIEIPDSPNGTIIPLENKFINNSIYVRAVDFYYGNKNRDVTCIGEFSFNKEEKFLESFNNSVKAQSDLDEVELEKSKGDPAYFSSRLDQMKLLYINQQTDQNYIFDLTLNGFHENKSNGDASFYETFSPEYATTWKMECSSWSKINSQVYVNCNISENFSPGWIDKGDPGDHMNKKLSSHFINFNIGNPEWKILNKKKIEILKSAKMYIIYEPILLKK
ncbi:hypothetical protein CH381_32935 [Leptospira sp. mixed culture ATI2-C-A1]|nr:hypothetical protein CH381_32935 [Leptospira sp. mixed culture ATI2-C-A1]